MEWAKLFTKKLKKILLLPSIPRYTLAGSGEKSKAAVNGIQRRDGIGVHHSPGNKFFGSSMAEPLYSEDKSRVTSTLKSCVYVKSLSGVVKVSVKRTYTLQTVV